MFDVPAESATKSIPEFARQAGLQIIAPGEKLRNIKTHAIKGQQDARAALEVLLEGTGLQIVADDGRAITLAAVAPKPTAPIKKTDFQGAQATQPANEDVVVTGTRIRGSAPIGSTVTVISRNAIEKSGAATVTDYLRNVPQNYTGGDDESNYGSNPHTSDNVGYGSGINLRGLGTESTLVLFDGARPAVGGTTGSFTDTSLIPTGAIDRVEILADGASAVYGTDAVAGVVNIRFRKPYDGIETNIFNGIAAGGALHQFQASQLVGKTWSTGGILVAYQYDYRSRLSGSDRAVATEDLRPWGGPDQRGNYSAPGTLIAANGAVFGIPGVQDGKALNASDLLPGQPNITDRDKQIDLLPQQTTNSVYATFDQTISDHVSVYARALYARRAYDKLSFYQSYTPRAVPITNPFYVDPIGTDQPVSVAYDFSRELGQPHTSGRVEGITTIGGLNAKFGGWEFDLGGTWGKQNTDDVESNIVSSTRTAIALADTNPATALNLFGDGTGNNPATLAFIRASYRDYTRSTVWSAALRVDGNLFDLPAGAVKLAAGAEHRHEYFLGGYYYDTVSSTPGDFGNEIAPGTPGARHVDAVYGELSIPIFNSGSVFPGHLDASLAGRVDWYSDVGRTTNPKAGLSWTPLPGVKLRGSWGTSFRAPTFYESAGVSQNAYYSYYIQDPNSPSGSSPVLLLTGYAPHVRPEKATTWSAGIDFAPPSLPGVSFSATYFDIHYRDRIASLGAYTPQILAQPDVYGSLIQSATPQAVAAIFASPQFVNLYSLQPSDIRYIINIEVQNLSRTEVRGLDFNLGYTHALLGGTGSVDLNGTRLFAYDQNVTGVGPSTSILGQIYNPVPWRLRGHIGWTGARVSADAYVNYTDGYSNNLVTPAEPVSSWTTLDAQIGYHFEKALPFKGATIALSATNLLNKAPPYVNYSVYSETLAYDPNQASAIGRLVSVRLSLDW